MNNHRILAWISVALVSVQLLLSGLFSITFADTDEVRLPWALEQFLGRYEISGLTGNQQSTLSRLKVEYSVADDALDAQHDNYLKIEDGIWSWFPDFVTGYSEGVEAEYELSLEKLEKAAEDFAESLYHVHLDYLVQTYKREPKGIGRALYPQSNVDNPIYEAIKKEYFRRNSDGLDPQIMLEHERLTHRLTSFIQDYHSIPQVFAEYVETAMIVGHNEQDQEAFNEKVTFIADEHRRLEDDVADLLNHRSLHDSQRIRLEAMQLLLADLEAVQPARIPGKHDRLETFMDLAGLPFYFMGTAPAMFLAEGVEAFDEGNYVQGAFNSLPLVSLYKQGSRLTHIAKGVQSGLRYSKGLDVAWNQTGIGSFTWEIVDKGLDKAGAGDRLTNITKFTIAVLPSMVVGWRTGWRGSDRNRTIYLDGAYRRRQHGSHRDGNHWCFIGLRWS